MGLEQIIKEIKELKILVSPSDYYLKIKILSQYSGISERKLRELIHHPIYPLPSYKVEGNILIKKSEFDQWIQRFKQVSDEINVDAVINDVMKDLQKV